MLFVLCDKGLERIEWNEHTGSGVTKRMDVESGVCVGRVVEKGGEMGRQAEVGRGVVGNQRERINERER